LIEKVYVRGGAMQTKLTLRLDDRLVEKAKAWARANDTSLSAAVAQFFAQLPVPDEQLGLSKLSPWTRSLLGAARVRGQPAPTDQELLEDYVDYLEEKYR
jgi:hypothetical protein